MATTISDIELALVTDPEAEASDALAALFDFAEAWLLADVEETADVPQT